MSHTSDRVLSLEAKSGIQGGFEMHQLARNNQAPWRIKNIVSEITPALLSCLWWLIIIICMVVLLAAAANP
ncbi:MAG TPA: hypothetical protein VFR08_09605 [Candidatus Angelobacter sp.]|nr:hypothetical protein [Candidatus Angelobacter sp.]